MEDIDPGVKAAIEEIYFWQYHNTNSFMNRLITLFQVADRENSRRLERGFPLIAIAYNMWLISPNQDDFFREYLPERFNK